MSVWFDWSEMARGSLGPSWRSADPTKRARFITVFKDVLAAQYMDDIDKFEGTEKVTVDGSAREGDATVVNTTLITASREHVLIDYRLREESGRWMIVDISIENVSLVNHFRKTFANNWFPAMRRRERSNRAPLPAPSVAGLIIDDLRGE